MYTFFKYILTAFFLIPSISKGQDFFDNNYIDSCVKSLRLKQVDTIILFSPSTNALVPNFDTIKGIGPIAIFSNDYLLYSHNSTNYIQKIIKGSSGYNDSVKSVISKPLIIHNDSLYKWLKLCIPKIKDEHFLPFVCKYKLNGMTVYDECGESEALSYDIIVYLKNDSIKKYFQEFVTRKTLMENSPKFSSYDRENLNYRYNSQTTLYKFYRRINKLIEVIDSRFDFQY